MLTQNILQKFLRPSIVIRTDSLEKLPVTSRFHRKAQVKRELAPFFVESKKYIKKQFSRKFRKRTCAIVTVLTLSTFFI